MRPQQTRCREWNVHYWTAADQCAAPATFRVVGHTIWRGIVYRTERVLMCEQHAQRFTERHTLPNALGSIKAYRVRKGNR